MPKASLYIFKQGFNADVLALKPSTFPVVNTHEAPTWEKEELPLSVSCQSHSPDAQPQERQMIASEASTAVLTPGLWLGYPGLGEKAPGDLKL